MTSPDLETYDEIPNCEWVVDYSGDVPQRLVKIDFDLATLMALVDVADAATMPLNGERTKENGAAIRQYMLKVIQQLERRSLHDYEQWNATAHLEGVDA